MSYYAGNITAEMATVLRKNATILIRLREKMECNIWQTSNVCYLSSSMKYRKNKLEMCGALQKCADLVGPETCSKFEQNKHLVANIRFETAENEPSKICCMIRARKPRFGIVSVHARL